MDDPNDPKRTLSATYSQNPYIGITKENEPKIKVNGNIKYTL